MTWQLDAAHSAVEFGVKHMVMTTVKGKFAHFDVDADVNEQDIAASTATITIDAGSVTTGMEDRDKHLRSDDFFNAEQYPKITFQLKRLEPKGDDGEYRFIGDLTIRDVTKEITLDGEVTGPVDDLSGGKRIGLSAEGRLNRKDYHLKFHVPLANGGALVADSVKFSIDAELTKAA